MNWGFGAGIVTFVVIAYMLGNHITSTEFLINLAISAVVGVAVGLWLGRDRRRSAADPGVFDERATRRAVRRGIVRTALAAVVWVFLGSVALSFASSFWQERGSREHHLDLVLKSGVAATLPGWNTNGGGCCNVHFRSLEFFVSGTPIVASPLAQSRQFGLRVNLRGRLTNEAWLNELPATGVDAAVSSAFDTSNGALRTKLRRLPAGVVATAVIELRAGETVGAFYRLLTRHGIVYPNSSELHVYLQPDNGTPYAGSGNAYARRVSWPSPAVAGFQDWVKQLHHGDNGLLSDLQLPPVATLNTIAAHPRIYGFVLPHAAPRQLLRFLADVAVSTVRVGDIAYNLSPGT